MQLENEKPFKDCIATFAAVSELRIGYPYSPGLVHSSQTPVVAGLVAYSAIRLTDSHVL